MWGMNNVTPVARLDHVNEEIFTRIVRGSQPVVIEGCDFGECMSKWNLGYLTEKLADQQIVIHESKSHELDFLRKNFKYRTCKFSEFSQRLSKVGSDSEAIYLRSTHGDPRAKKAARIEEDFPPLSNDLRPPNFVPFGKDNQLYHSSVLRISSANVQIWTHFDLYDNVLCQIVGTKRIILFEPSDSKYLYISGDKSRVNNFDDVSNMMREFPLLIHAKARSCHLKPGDCIFIPALWWHNIRSTEDDTEQGYSIGFNIFWRDQELASRSLYANNDVYGNKHLVPYEAALTNVERALDHLKKLPEKHRGLHKLMLLLHLKKKLDIEDMKE